jgi:RNA polymerase sigma factor (TIGR02999 family)
VEPITGEITLLLEKWREGDSAAFESLMPLVYPHLREVAGAYLRRERTPDVMQATSLVHELYLRLLTQKRADWKDRAHFYTFCSKMMRLILIDQARAVQAQRRGGQVEHVPLSDEMPWVGIGSPQMIDLDTALNALAEMDAELAQMVELRFFLGCTTEETAKIAGVSEATVKRGLKFAKTWLFRRIAPTEKQIPSQGVSRSS